MCPSSRINTLTSPTRQQSIRVKPGQNQATRPLSAPFQVPDPSTPKPDYPNVIHAENRTKNNWTRRKQTLFTSISRKISPDHRQAGKKFRLVENFPECHKPLKWN